jgi:hypothetical protein
MLFQELVFPQKPRAAWRSRFLLRFNFKYCSIELESEFPHTAHN